jgi:tetratricopeptide (TPR) repeat protein
MDLEQALEDVGEAILHSPNENAAYLDTRGLIKHKLGHNEEALADLDRSIQLTAAKRDQWERQAEKERPDPRVRKLQAQAFDRDLAVMHHHRSQVHGALQHEAEAQEDAAKARELGFDPAQGIE